MAKLTPPNNCKMTKMHYEWLAWSIRRIASYQLGCSVNGLSAHPDMMRQLARDWAEECLGTNPAFNRDRFISAVINGEW